MDVAEGELRERWYGPRFVAHRLRWGTCVGEEGRHTYAQEGTVRGVQTVEEGAEIIVRMAQIGPDGPTGGFFDAAGPLPW